MRCPMARRERLSISGKQGVPWKAWKIEKKITPGLFDDE
jgi:hypothetical protein